MKKKYILFLITLFVCSIRADELKVANVSEKVFINYCSMVSLISSTIMTSYQYNYNMEDTKKKLKDIINEQKKLNSYSKKINSKFIDLMEQEVKEYKIEENETLKNNLIEEFKNEIYTLCMDKK